MKLFIANCTRQVLDFMYRLPEHPTPIHQKIEMGQQIAVPRDLSMPDIEYVVNQHRIYGMVDVKDVDHTKAFIGTCYSVDKPVSINKIQLALSHNTDVLAERGREQRKEAAVAISNQLDEATGGKSLTETDVSIVEEKGANGADPSFGEGVVVRKDVSEHDNGSAVKSSRQRRR
jgi:hypothetical protein